MSNDLVKAMRATAEGFLHDFEGQWKEGATMSYRAPGCIHVMLPTSLNYPVRDDKEWAAYFKNVAPLVSGAVMTINDFVAAPADRRAVVRSSMDATTPAGPVHNEYVWFFDFDESGEKITRIEEFLDSASTKDIREKFSKAGLHAGHLGTK